MENNSHPTLFSRRNAGIALILIVVVALITWAALPKSVEETGTTATDSARVRRGDLVLTATGEGTLEQVSIPMGFIASGTLVDIAEPGDVIQAGEVLAQLDSRQAELNLEAAALEWQEILAASNSAALQVEQMNAEALLADTQQEYDEVVNGPDVALYEALLARAIGDYWDAVKDWTDARNATRKNTALISRLHTLVLQAETAIEDAQADLDWAINYQANPTDVLLAEANLAKAESDFSTTTILAQNFANGAFEVSLDNQGQLPELQVVQGTWDDLKQAQTRLDDLSLRAPFDSTVTQVNAQVGEQVNAYQPVLTLVAQGPLTVRFTLDESDIQNLAVGDRLDLSLSAYPNLQLVGEVTQIAPVVDTAKAQIIVWGVILPDEQVVTILPGMNVDVEVVLAEARDTLLVPKQAVRSREDGSSYVYRIASEGSLEEVTVTLGLSDVANVEILSGLQEGDLVSTAPAN